MFAKAVRGTLLAFTLLTAVLLPAGSAHAQEDVFRRACEAEPDSSLCRDRDDTDSQTRSSNALYGPNGVLTRIASFIAMLSGIAAIIMLLVGGFKYITSSGDASSIKSAKDTILFAIVGIIIAASAQALVAFVLTQIQSV